jgi:ABC-2 type transport system permease protein
MGTFSAYLKKEIVESIRQYKYIVLLVGILVFAISDPVMMKLLPKILKSQATGDLSSLFVVSPTIALQSFIKNLFQIGSMFIVFTAAGSLCDEVSNQKLVFPCSKGGRPASIVLAKVLHLGVTITLITFLGFLVNYYYTGILIKGTIVKVSSLLLCASLVSLYYIFNVCLAVFFSSFIKKGIVAGFLVLGITYFSTLLNSIEKVQNFLPYRLIYNASSFITTDITKTVIAIILYCIILISLAIYRMNRVEVI